MKEYTTTYSPERIIGLELCKSLFKDGCTWQGDLFDKKWGECLFFSADKFDRVSQTLAAYEAEVHYQLEHVEGQAGCVYII